MDLQRAILDIKHGKVVIIPTDTLHAISCDATNSQAVKDLIRIKGRKENHALPILVRDLGQAMEYGEFNKKALEFAEKHWGGALTIVVPLKQHSRLSPLIYGDKQTIAMRVPNGKIINHILNDLNIPIIGTSANMSGSANLFSEQEFRTVFGDNVETIIFSDSLQGVASTIIDCTSEAPQLIRQGAIKL